MLAIFAPSFIRSDVGCSNILRLKSAVMAAPIRIYAIRASDIDRVLPPKDAKLRQDFPVPEQVAKRSVPEVDGKCS